MRMLVVAGDVPASNSMPGSPRLFSLCRELSWRHELHLAAPCGSPERLRWFSDDAATGTIFKSITILPNPPAEATWWNRQRHRLHRGAYFESGYLYPDYHHQIVDTLREIASKEDTDLIYVDGLVMSQYAGWDGRIPAFIDAHDSLTLLFGRMVKAEPRWLRKAQLYLQAGEVERCERALGDTFSLIVTNSPVDEGVFRRLCPSVQTLTVGNGVDTEFFSPTGDSVQPKRLVFTGVLGYGPNEDAVLYFCDAILPLVREAEPEVEFWAVGSDPTDKVRALAQRPGVHVTGSVPDVRPYLASAGIFVCPLRWGAGVKNKILAALAMGKPLVATALSLEGLDLRADHDLLIATDERGFAERVVRLLRDPALGRTLGQNGQKSVRAKYSWRASATVLDGALRTIVGSSGDGTPRTGRTRAPNDGH